MQARLPSLYLGALIKEASGCPIVVDVDDFELSFFPERTPATLEDVRADATAALREPYEGLATRYAQTLVDAADAVTVSNIALRERFGGHMVRHARDETAFRPDETARAAARLRLGIAEHEFALVFVGTPRAHKGVGEVARALHELDDASIVFHVVGELTDAGLRQTLAACPKARVSFHPNCAFDELPVLLAAADLVPLIQDVDHPISQHQIPAKVSDALSLGVPVLATRTPPLADLIAEGAIIATDAASLADAIAAQRARASAEPSARHAISAAARRAFLGELSTAVNATRLGQAIEEARAASRPLSDEWSDLLELLRGEYERLRRAAIGTPASVPSGRVEEPVTDEATLAAHAARVRNGARKGAVAEGCGAADVVSIGSRLGRSVARRLPRLLGGRTPTYDIAFFWKQNDSGLYGRRSDMVAKYLLASGRVGRMAHFDAPVSVHALEQHYGDGALRLGGQQDLVLRSLYDRNLGLHDTERLRQRTFLSSQHERRGRLLGEPLPRREAYPIWVREQLEAAGMRPERTWAWFCPVVWDAPDLIERIGFAGVVSDLIDDQRAWDSNGPQTERLDNNYRRTLAASDIAFANCEPLAETMAHYADDIHVVPNGAERFVDRAPGARPAGLDGIAGPIAGYVGNLRDRVDWLLLQEVAAAMPDVSFVLAGPGGDNPNAHSLARFPNVHLPGVVPYEALPHWLAHFDVGLVPHVNNRLTARMNPLKVYNYFAAGLPIVSTEVANLGAVGGAIRTATDASRFADAIRAALGNRPDTSSPASRATMDSIAGTRARAPCSTCSTGAPVRGCCVRAETSMRLMRDGWGRARREKRAVRGAIDRFDGRRLDGWAIDPTVPERPLAVALLVDGVRVAEGLADGARPDLASSGLGTGLGGLSIVLDEPVVARERAARARRRIDRTARARRRARVRAGRSRHALDRCPGPRRHRRARHGRRGRARRRRDRGDRGRRRVRGERSAGARPRRSRLLDLPADAAVRRSASLVRGARGGARERLPRGRRHPAGHPDAARGAAGRRAHARLRRAVRARRAALRRVARALARGGRPTGRGRLRGERRARARPAGAGSRCTERAAAARVAGHRFAARVDHRAGARRCGAHAALSRVARAVGRPDALRGRAGGRCFPGRHRRAGQRRRPSRHGDERDQRGLPAQLPARRRPSARRVPGVPEQRHRGHDGLALARR